MNEVLSLLLALAIAILYVSTRRKLKNLRSTIMALKDKIAAVEAAQLKVTADVENVKGLVGTLKEDVVLLTALVEELRGQLPTPELEARLQVVADSLNSIDEQLDILAPDPVVEVPPVEPPVEEPPV